MNYREVAVLICQIIGYCCLIDAVLMFVDYFPLISNSHNGASLPLRLLWLLPSLLLLFIGLAVLVLQQGFAELMVPHEMEDNWTPRLLCTAAVGMSLTLYESQLPAQYMVEMLFARLGIDDFTRGQLAKPYIIIHSLVGGVGFLLWLVPARWELHRRKLAADSPSTEIS